MMKAMHRGSCQPTTLTVCCRLFHDQSARSNHGSRPPQILAVAEMLSGLTAPVAGTTEAVSADVSGTAQGDTAEVPQERKTTGEMLRKGRRPSVELLAREVRSHNADDAGARQAVGAVAAVLETEVAPPVNTQGPLAKLARDHARRTSLRSAQASDGERWERRGALLCNTVCTND